MHLQKSATGAIVLAPAKLNLFFEVLGKRKDGYHEVETLVTPVDLYDTLHFEARADGQIHFECCPAPGFRESDGSWFRGLPDGAENLVVRAVELLRRRSGERRGATLRLVKRIPTAAGLGGGSSDAAAALAAANACWGLGWSWEDLAGLGAELGSDVPLFFVGGPAFCRGRGERVERVAALGRLHFVLVRPPEGLSTAAVYQACVPGTPPRIATPLVESLTRGELALAGRCLFNRLESAAQTISPWIRRLRAEFEKTECVGHQMSGSGTCYFGLCRHAKQARRIARRLQARGVGVAFAVQGCR
jgi:4-diphosphocytidyl-2-C-methyl-D-erythritol kinase